VINSNQLGQVHDGAGLIHPAAKTLSWTTGYALNTGNLANGAQASHVTTQSGCTLGGDGTSTSWVGFTTDGSGTGAQFTVTFNNAGPDLITQVTVARAGTGYKAGDTIAFSAAALNTPTYGTQAMTLCTGTVTIKLTTADLNKSANSGKPTTTTALYTGDTLSIDTFYGVQTGSDFIDDESLIKWVDASSQNGCDDNDGAANDAAQRLAGHPDVRGSAHVMVPTGTSTCSSPMGTTTFNNFDQAADITTANRAS
jgi:hypothetical protein